MLVMKISTGSGEYVSEGYSPNLVAEILRRAPDWQKVERVQMTEEEYRSIPATNESARLFE